MITSIAPGAVRRHPLLTLGCAIAGLVVVVVACGWRERAARAPSPPAVLPPRVVLRIDRIVVPIGGPIRYEALAVTADGACAPDVACRRVAHETMARLYPLARDVMHARHRDEAASPHYGSRSIAVELPDGRLAVSDGSQAPLDERDEPAFYAAFDAIANAPAAP